MELLRSLAKPYPLPLLPVYSSLPAGPPLARCPPTQTALPRLSSLRKRRAPSLCRRWVSMARLLPPSRRSPRSESRVQRSRWSTSQPARPSRGRRNSTLLTILLRPRACLSIGGQSPAPLRLRPVSLRSTRRESHQHLRPLGALRRAARTLYRA